MVLDENSNNLTGAVISVTGINHDITSGRQEGSFCSLSPVELGTICKPEQPAIKDAVGEEPEEGKVPDMGAKRKHGIKQPDVDEEILSLLE